MTRTRLACTRLEDRRTPALSVLAAGGSLTLTGTPTAASPGSTVGWNQAVSITRTTGDLYQVKDGAKNLGTFKVTRDLNLLFDSIDNDVVVDLNGGTLKGNLTVDLGQGDRQPQTRNIVTVVGNDGQVNGGMAFRGSSSDEAFAVGTKIFYASFTFSGTTYYFEFLSAPSPVTVKQDVSATGAVVTTGYEDDFQLGSGSVVKGSVLTNRVTYTTVLGTVKKDVTAVTNVPGGMGFYVGGEVDGDVYAEGSASIPGYYSYALLAGTVKGNATVRVTGGDASVELDGRVGKNFTYESEGQVNSSVTILAYAPYEAAGEVGGSAVFNFRSDAGTSNSVTIAGKVKGSVVVNDGAGDLSVAVGTTFEDYDPDTGEPFTAHAPGTVKGGIFVNAGEGTNSFTFDGAIGSTAGGPAVYTGGSGKDTVSVTGKNTFDLMAFLGGGGDTVQFAADARVKSALVVFGATGTKTWVPPAAIDFPLWLLNY